MLKGKHYENKISGVGYTLWKYKGARIAQKDGEETCMILFVNDLGKAVVFHESTFEKALAYVDEWVI